MSYLSLLQTVFTVTHLLVVIAVIIRVIMRRPATGVALAWLLLVAALPVGGAAPTVCGSSFQMFDDTQEILRAIVRDVDAAETSVLMEFYIWNEGGAADGVLEAVIRAARRGVSCRLLIDALGARPWWRGKQPQRLRDAGVELQDALPVGFFRTFVGRTDLRVHRKIVVVDGNVAWTGSMNMVDPRFFKQDSGVGELSMFGTVNLDMRSLWINYEVALFVYDPGFATELRGLQQTYIDVSDRLDPAQWAARSGKDRFLQNAMRLVSPLL